MPVQPLRRIRARSHNFLPAPMRGLNRSEYNNGRGNHPVTTSNGAGYHGRQGKAKRRFSIAPLLFSAACLTTSFSLTTSLRAEGFSLEASPGTVYLKQDEKATSTITVHPSGDFNGSVTLLASRLPPGVTASFDPESTTSASKLVFVAAKEAAIGLSSVIVTGTSGNLTQSATISLAVTAATAALPHSMKAGGEGQ
jgi:hypothetical protein